MAGPLLRLDFASRCAGRGNHRDPDGAAAVGYSRVRMFEYDSGTEDAVVVWAAACLGQTGALQA